MTTQNNLWAPRNVHPDFHGSVALTTPCSGWSGGEYILTECAGTVNWITKDTPRGTQILDHSSKHERTNTSAAGEISHVSQGTWGAEVRIRNIMRNSAVGVDSGPHAEIYTKADMESALRAEGLK